MITNKLLNNLIEERAKYIEEKIQSFGVTKENAKEYHIEIVKSTTYNGDGSYTSKDKDEYKIYKLVGTFKA